MGFRGGKKCIHMESSLIYCAWKMGGFFPFLLIFEVDAYVFERILSGKTNNIRPILSTV